MGASWDLSREELFSRGCRTYHGHRCSVTWCRCRDISLNRHECNRTYRTFTIHDLTTIVSFRVPNDDGSSYESILAKKDPPGSILFPMFNMTTISRRSCIVSDFVRRPLSRSRRARSSFTIRLDNSSNSVYLFVRKIPKSKPCHSLKAADTSSTRGSSNPASVSSPTLSAGKGGAL